MVANQAHKTSYSTFKAILILMVLMQMTAEQYLSSLPAIAHTFNTSSDNVQLSITLYMLGAGISHMFYGPLSDRVGRKLPLMLGVSISIIGSIFCYIAPSITVLIIGRFLQGFGIGCGLSVGRTIIRDLYNKTLLAKISSFVAIINIVFIIIAPVLGGYIQEHFGWRANFLFLIVFGFIVLFTTRFFLKETNNNPNPNATKTSVMRSNYKLLIRSRVFMGHTLCTCLAWAGIVSYMTISPFLFHDIFGLSPVDYGWLTVFIATGICISGVINSQLVVWKGIFFMIKVGVLLMIFSGLLLICLSLSGIQSILSIMIPVCLFTVGAGFTFINTFVGAFEPFPAIAGTVGALYASLIDLSGAVVSGIIAVFFHHTVMSLGVTLFVLGLLSLLAFKMIPVVTNDDT